MSESELPPYGKLIEAVYHQIHQSVLSEGAYSSELWSRVKRELDKGLPGPSSMRTYKDVETFVAGFMNEVVSQIRTEVELDHRRLIQEDQKRAEALRNREGYPLSLFPREINERYRNFILRPLAENTDAKDQDEPEEQSGEDEGDAEAA